MFALIIAGPYNKYTYTHMLVAVTCNHTCHILQLFYQITPVNQAAIDAHWV